ncbi:MAG: hypothetical protein FJ295_08675 [Planctomycetes bacterium]|nr:hypothetical protein [Planctomycetota bacterium]
MRHPCSWLPRVGDIDHQIRALDCLPGEFDSLQFDRVPGISNARRITDHDRPSVDQGVLLEQIASCACFVVHESARESQQPVHQRALADVGSAGDDDAPRFGQVPAEFAVLVQLLQSRHNLVAPLLRHGVVDSPQFGSQGTVELFQQITDGA